MKPSPLKGKVICICDNHTYYGSDGKCICEGNFKRKDVKSAVEWLKEEYKKAFSYNKYKSMCNKLDEAFPDLK